MGRGLWVGAAAALAAACGEKAAVTSDEPCQGGCPVEVHVCPAGGDAEGCGPRTPAIAWARSIAGAQPGGAWVVDVGSDASGRRYALSVGDYAGWSGDGDGVVARLRLQTFEPSGGLVADRQWDIRRDPGTLALAVAPGGDVYVLASGSCSGVMYRAGKCADHTVDLGAGPIVESGLVKLGAGGAVIWQKPLGAHTIAADVTGAVIAGGQERVARLAPDGSVLWSREVGPVERCASAPGGDAVCALTDFSAKPPASTTRVVRLAAADGSTLWTRDLPELRFVHGVRASRSNVVVLGAPEAAFASGEAQTVLGQALLLAFAPDGSPLWTRAIEASPRQSYGGTGPAARLGGDAEGRSAIAVADAACGSRVHVLEPDGAPSWTVPLVADGACSSGPFVTNLDVAADGAVLVGGGVYEDGVVVGATPLAWGRFVALIAPR